MADEKELLERIHTSHRRLHNARVELGLVLEEINGKIKSGEMDIYKHVGLPETKPIWNEIGVPFYLVGDYSDFEKVFKEMLSVINAIEDERKGKHIHKGLALYHIGISQINQRNFDEGIPNVLAAYEEDRKTYGDAKAKKLFAYNFNKDFLETLSEQVDKDFFNEIKTHLPSKADLKKKSLKDLVEEFDENEKLFFAKTINSKIVNKFSKDFYTRIVLWDNLRNMCLLLEIFLKRRTGSTNMLGGLIPATFQNEAWLGVYKRHRGTRDANDYTYYGSTSDFSQKLQTLLTGSLYSQDSEIDFLARLFLLSVLVRNFTAHNFDEYEKLLVDENLYENVFKYVMFSLLYTLHFLD